ncbi:RNA ligase [Rossellomorea marisflavi]|uniref:RNA ligase n=1 Tax=Rossellomorea marisflavi TaxID=189381 RepID=UPI003FA06D16
MKLLSHDTQKHQHALSLQHKVIRLFEKLVPALTGVELKDATDTLMRDLRMKGSVEQLESFLMTHQQEWDEITLILDEEATATTLGMLLDKLNIYMWTINGERLVQLNYSKGIGRWWNLLTENSRGHLFTYPELKLVSLPFHKFYNMNEREETKLEKLDDTHPITIMEKLDGSMIHLFEVGGELVSGTRGSVGEYYYNDKAISLLTEKNKKAILALIRDGYTPMFEILLKEGDQYGQTVRYQEDGLKLIAIRHRESGAYVHPATLCDIAEGLGMKSTTHYADKALADIFEEQKTVKNLEGWVLYFENGMMVKLKAEDYLEMNYSFNIESRMKAYPHIIERTLYEWVVENVYDDYLSSIKDEDFRTELETTLERIQTHAQGYFKKLHVKFNEHFTLDRKAFSLALVKDEEVNEMDFHLIFKLYKGETLSLKEIPWEAVKKYEETIDLSFK